MLMRQPQSAQSDDNTGYAGTNELWSIERYLTNYNQFLIQQFTTAAGNATQVLEFGAGIGTLATLWKNTTGVKPECLDIDCAHQQIIKSRGFECYSSVENITKKFDVVYTSNVLEHIKDDLSTLKQINFILKDKGYLLIYVPAFQILYSDLDQRVGHYRRYSKRGLGERLLHAGFDVKNIYFSDSLGFIAWLYLKIRTIGSQQQEKNMWLYDKYIFPLSKLLDALGCRYLFGKNLFVYAQKRDSTTTKTGTS